MIRPLSLGAIASTIILGMFGAGCPPCPDSDSPWECDPCPDEVWKPEFVESSRFQGFQVTDEVESELLRNLEIDGAVCPTGSTENDRRDNDSCLNASFEPDITTSECHSVLVLSPIPPEDHEATQAQCDTKLGFGVFISSRFAYACDSHEGRECWRISSYYPPLDVETSPPPAVSPPTRGFSTTLRIYSRFDFPNDLRAESELSPEEFFSETDEDGEPTLIIVRTFESAAPAEEFPFEGVERDEEGVLRCSDVLTGYFSRPPDQEIAR